MATLNLVVTSISSSLRTLVERSCLAIFLNVLSIKGWLLSTTFFGLQDYNLHIKTYEGNADLYVQLQTKYLFHAILLTFRTSLWVFEENQIIILLDPAYLETGKTYF